MSALNPLDRVVARIGLRMLYVASLVSRFLAGER